MEHDPDWHTVVSQRLGQFDINNVNCILCEPERTDALMKIYASTDERYQGMSFHRYAKTIDVYPDSNFDLVVVDGRARVGCINHALSKVRIGGFLLLDDSDREEYERGKNLMSGWARHRFYGPSSYNRIFTATTIWKKPLL